MTNYQGAIDKIIIKYLYYLHLNRCYFDQTFYLNHFDKGLIY